MRGPHQPQYKHSIKHRQWAILYCTAPLKSYPSTARGKTSTEYEYCSYGSFRMSQTTCHNRKMRSQETYSQPYVFIQAHSSLEVTMYYITCKLPRSSTIAIQYNVVHLPSQMLQTPTCQTTYRRSRCCRIEGEPTSHKLYILHTSYVKMLNSCIALPVEQVATTALRINSALFTLSDCRYVHYTFTRNCLYRMFFGMVHGA